MLDVLTVAQVCHEANRVIQERNGDPVSVSWLDLDDETKASAIDGVEFARSGATPIESHHNWSKFKIENGWVWGPEKDEVAKTHPCLVAYSELPESQRIKDSLFLAIVGSLS